MDQVAVTSLTERASPMSLGEWSSEGDKLIEEVISVHYAFTISARLDGFLGNEDVHTAWFQEKLNRIFERLDMLFPNMKLEQSLRTVVYGDDFFCINDQETKSLLAFHKAWALLPTNTQSDDVLNLRLGIASVFEPVLDSLLRDLERKGFWTTPSMGNMQFYESYCELISKFKQRYNL